MTIEQDQTQTEQPAIPNYLVWSILATCLCCIPTGIYAIILSSKVDALVAQNKIEEAKQTSAKAKKWIFMSVGLGIVFTLIYLLGIALISKEHWGNQLQILH